jgi:CubicO group peptidase (beta-lactamase class C family)
MRLIVLVLLVTPLCLYAHDYDWPIHKKALVAGYKGVFTCAGIFNGGKSLEQIAKDELTGIRPEFQSIMATIPDAVINYDKKYVSVSYDSAVPPRVIVWRPYLGCSQLPVGASYADADIIPRIKLTKPKAIIEPWPVGDPKTVKQTNNKDLQQVINAAFDGKTYGDGAPTTAILISTPSEMFAEQYRNDYTPYTSQRTWSAAKSMAATLIGVAVKEKLIDLNNPANIPEWQAKGDPRKRITLENILHMGSGLFSGPAGNRTDKVYWGGNKITDTATREPLEVNPGQRWKYANNDTMLLMRNLRASIDNDDAYLRYPFEKLFHKIGMYNTVPETDWEGNFVMSSQVWTTARDLGRLGILYLNNGQWQGEQILPENWAKYVSTSAPAQPKGDWGYGGQFWLYEGLGYAARGNRGQIVMILPKHNIVIVRRGYDSATGGRFDIVAFTTDVLNALKSK